MLMRPSPIEKSFCQDPLSLDTEALFPLFFPYIHWMNDYEALLNARRHCKAPENRIKSIPLPLSHTCLCFWTDAAPLCSFTLVYFTFLCLISAFGKHHFRCGHSRVTVDFHYASWCLLHHNWMILYILNAFTQACWIIFCFSLHLSENVYHSCTIHMCKPTYFDLLMAHSVHTCCQSKAAHCFGESGHFHIIVTHSDTLKRWTAASQQPPGGPPTW